MGDDTPRSSDREIGTVPLSIKHIYSLLQRRLLLSFLSASTVDFTLQVTELEVKHTNCGQQRC